ncbi:MULTISPECIES: HAD family hydrolase [unclassified Moraxella]|uniref:HAD family hydrolase n=1 Tax=unclassified Moraxella TaxID=2685852 RepID=UPI003AF677E1
MKKLIILDLDETLIHASHDIIHNDYDFIVGDYFVYQRPCLTEFLAFCFAHADVAVWTSSGSWYADIVTQMIFTDEQRQALRFIFSREKCVQRMDFYRYENVYIKDLKKLKKRYSLEQMIMIDNSPEKLARNYGNLVRVADFTGQKDDTELLNLMRYLPNLLNEPSVRTIEKRNWRL